MNLVMPIRDIIDVQRLFSSSAEENEPLIVDILPIDGIMFVRLLNLEPYPLKKVTIEFNQPLPGPGGRPLNDLNIFQRLRYLAPGREIDVPAGRDATFLKSLRNPVLQISIRLQLPKQRTHKYTIEHDLSIYEDLPLIQSGSTL